MSIPNFKRKYDSVVTNAPRKLNLKQKRKLICNNITLI